jgi:ubiquinol-cytochrome c reductase cytochrome b subunit
MSITARLERAIDGSVGGRRFTAFVGSLRHRAVPTHWTGLFGVITMACVVVLLVSGVFLMFFYTPSSATVTYRGGYAPLHGVEMSKAFASTLGVSFDVRGGLLLRQAHHWAALLLPAALILQLAATFFTGAFRRPRQWNWVLLFLILIAALAAGWSGYALPDDLLSGTGLRIVEGIVLGIPIVGTGAATLLFGGGFPGRVIENLYVIHLLVSAGLIALIAARLRSGWVHGPVQFPARGRGEDAVVGVPLLPTAATRAFGLFATVCGLLVVVSATVTVGPVWLYGPSSPSDVSAGSQPDWYTGFLDGALRLVPPGWELEIGGYTLTLAVLVPLAVVGAFLLAIVAYPFLEGWILRDRGEHRIPATRMLDRPRNVPTRTGLGVGAIAFYGVLWGAASSDLLATHFRLSLEGVIVAFQVLVLVAPPFAFVLTRRVCLGLRRRDREVLVHGFETGRIVRMPGGEYVEQHRPVDVYERWRLLDHSGYAPLQLRPDAKGRIHLRDRARVALSRALFEDRAAPATGSVPVRR